MSEEKPKAGVFKHTYTIEIYTGTDEPIETGWGKALGYMIESLRDDVPVLLDAFCYEEGPVKATDEEMLRLLDILGLMEN